MAITAVTARHVDQLRSDLDVLAAHTTRQLTTAWASEWDTLVYDIAAAAADLERLRGDRWPTRMQVAQHERTQQALAAAHRALDRLTGTTRDHADTAAVAAAVAVVAAQGRLIVSQLPPDAQSTWRPTPPDPDEQAAAQQDTKRRLRRYLAPLAAAAGEALRRRFTRGAHTGGPAGGAARQVVDDAERAFNAGLTRALAVTQTELADAARTAAMLTQLANADVLAGWEWRSRRDRTTCGSCWAQDGSVYPLDQPGPWDHPNGRCIRLPVVKTWRELGFDIPETFTPPPDAQSVFWAMPRELQLQVMGPGRLAGLESGDIAWADLSRLRTNPGWRDSWTLTPLRDLLPD